MYVDDTIVAISTVLGESAIGVLRVSGSEAISIVDKVFRGQKTLSDTPTYHARYGYIYENDTDSQIDEVICLVMRAPHSFTTEDTVEISCHGGVVSVRRILRTILDAGARLADPGEFTKRAFLNGRIDLAQAEAIIQIINAQTETGMEIAVQQLKGQLSKKINQLRQKLIRVLAHLEAALDFPEDEIQGFSTDEISKSLQKAISEIENLVKTSQSGKIFRQGIKTIIVGKPNVGKSSLLNTLLSEQRAIVTEIPGTTRDLIEEMIDLDGIPLRLIDTAGIRETEDKIENIGVERSKEFLSTADLVLLVLDISQDLTSEDWQIIQLAKNKKVIIVLNKLDLPAKIDENAMVSELKKLIPVHSIVRTSVLFDEGLDELKNSIKELIFAGQIIPTDQTILINLRHQRALSDAQQSLRRAEESFHRQMPYDIVSIDLRAGLEFIGQITGETLADDMIDQIFAEFCLGK